VSEWRNKAGTSSEKILNREDITGQRHARVCSKTKYGQEIEKVGEIDIKKKKKKVRKRKRVWAFLVSPSLGDAVHLDGPALQII